MCHIRKCHYWQYWQCTMYIVQTLGLIKVVWHSSLFKFHSTLNNQHLPFHSDSTAPVNTIMIKVYSMQSICTLTSFKVSGDESAAPVTHLPDSLTFANLLQPAVHCRHPLFSIWFIVCIHCIHAESIRQHDPKKNNSESESKGHYVFNPPHPVHLVCSHSISPHPHLNLIDNI